MTWAGAFFVVMAFLAIARLLGVPSRVVAVAQCSRGALEDLRSKGLSDIEKERALRAHALRLFVLFLVLTASMAAAAGVPVGVISLLDLANLVALDAVLELMLSWELLLGTAVLCFAALAISRRKA